MFFVRIIAEAHTNDDKKGIHLANGVLGECILNCKCIACVRDSRVIKINRTTVSNVALVITLIVTLIVLAIMVNAIQQHKEKVEAERRTEVAKQKSVIDETENVLMAASQARFPFPLN